MGLRGTRCELQAVMGTQEERESFYQAANACWDKHWRKRTWKTRLRQWWLGIDGYARALCCVQTVNMMEDSRMLTAKARCRLAEVESASHART